MFIGIIIRFLYRVLMFYSLKQVIETLKDSLVNVRMSGSIFSFKQNFTWLVALSLGKLCRSSWNSWQGNGKTSLDKLPRRLQSLPASVCIHILIVFEPYRVCTLCTLVWSKPGVKDWILYAKTVMIIGWNPRSILEREIKFTIYRICFSLLD